jgi:hypothetical protein
MKKKILLVVVLLPLFMAGQQAIIIDHTCLDLDQIPDEYIDIAKADLWIGYGHTSHGSQLNYGMEALENYFVDGTYNWGNGAGGSGEVHVDDGGSGYLTGDCGELGWDSLTRTYLDNYPDCNVIMWSWCNQVNSVDLSSHYLGPMNQLELDYPDVQFVYMTAHLQGQGPGGSLYLANQQIRDYCIANNKILYDFADIEKYSPDADTNYQEYFATDGCEYNLPGGGTANWANNWLAANPGHELTQISQVVSSCPHSVSLNCTKKGIACWFLWARLAGWEGTASIIEKKSPLISNFITIFPNPARDDIKISFQETIFCKTLEIWDLSGRKLYSKQINKSHNELIVSDINIPAGVYVVTIVSDKQVYKGKLSLNK